MSAHAKQTLHHMPPLIALADHLHILPHHTKPYRKRHILILVVAIIFFASMVLELGAVITRQSLDPRSLFSEAATPVAVNPVTKVNSSNGFAFKFNSTLFTATALGDGIEGQTTDAELQRGHALNSVTLNPLPSYVPAIEAATEFDVRIEPDAAAFATFKASAKPGQDMETITADYFAPKTTNSVDSSQVSRIQDSVNGVQMTKSVYKLTPRFAGGPTHTIVWTKQLSGKPVAVTIRGIIGTTEVPSSIAPILATLEIAADAKVQGISTLFGASTPVPVLDQKYVADLVSPAVVKIYHVVCGTLVFKGQVLAADSCTGMTGSGFLVSGDGYIATNGHVVVFDAKDVLVNALLHNRTLLEQFLQGTTMTSKQISEVMNNQTLLASVVSGIYDIPNNQLKFANERKITIAALGNTPLQIENEQTLKGLVDNFAETNSLKKAEVLDYDYSAKDQLTVIADPKKGFSASDVALLKIAISNAPLVRMSSNPVTQNQKVTLFGFPGDAENQLTDNSSLGVTVTNGSISSIRDAAGSSSKLYQSDADASHGNSGGPAVNDEGEAFGLLTYRFASGEVTDAAKSYIRDITDFKKLASNKNVKISNESVTQTAWREGLDLYSKHHYYSALKKFESVKRQYPAHRLADTYIGLSKQAIKDGKNVPQLSPLLLTLGASSGLGGLGLAVVMIARHHGKHQVYRAFRRHGLQAHHARA